MSEQTITRTPGLAAGLVAAQRAARPVAKDAQNQFHRYRYASSEDVIAEAREALGVGDLALFAGAAKIREHHPSEGEPSYVVEVTYLLVHASGEERRITSETPVIPEKGRPLDKALAAAKTYDLAYCLRTLLLLPRGTDDGGAVEARDDRDRGHREPPPSPAPPKPPAPQAPAPQAPAPKPEDAAALSAWWGRLQALGLDGDAVRELAHELYGATSPRALTATQRDRLYVEAELRRNPAVDAQAKRVLDEARGGAR